MLPPNRDARALARLWASHYLPELLIPALLRDLSVVELFAVYVVLIRFRRRSCIDKIHRLIDATMMTLVRVSERDDDLKVRVGFAEHLQCKPKDPANGRRVLPHRNSRQLTALVLL